MDYDVRVRLAAGVLMLIACSAEPPDPAEVYLTPTEHLVRASMALRGVRPSLEELRAVDADASAAAIRAFAGRVHGLHLKDVAAANSAAPDVILGEGVVDLVAVFRALREIELPADATISLEYESNPFMPFDDIARCLDHVAEAAHASLRG
jgi:L-ribulose-5-phosphate 3-epimerase UlaE